MLTAQVETGERWGHEYGALSEINLLSLARCRQDSVFKHVVTKLWKQETLVWCLR